MLAMGRAIISRPKLLMLDEPSGICADTCAADIRHNKGVKRCWHNNSAGGAERGDGSWK